VLRRLLEVDNEDRYSTVHIKHYFVFRGHMCITFELLSSNLFEVIKNNRYKGLQLEVIRRFAFQILQSLRLMRKCGIIHCDLKPENILLKEQNKTRLKVIDFGSACFDG
jgi:dual specificity tyrosine-phosphorylation-regulated kinase 2/3/4